jgi:hypothetical protein
MSAVAKEEEAFRKRIEALLRLPENEKCCDCRKRGTIMMIKKSMYIYICICVGAH